MIRSMISKTEAEEDISTNSLPAAQNEDVSLHLKNVLFRDSLGYMMSKVVPGFFGLITVPVFVRLIGIEEYGRLSVILPILLALAGAGSGWLQQSMLRFHPDSQDSISSKLSFSRAVVLGTSYAVLALGLVLAPVLQGLHCRWDIWLIAEAYCAIQLVYLVSLTRLQAELRPKSVLKNEAMRSASGFILPVVLVLVTGQRSFPFVLLGLALGYLLPLLTNIGKWRSATEALWLNDSEERDAGRILGRLWRFGWAVGVWLMLCQALPIVGRSAIQRYAGYAEAGIYASLYELAVRSFSLFASPVTQAAHPRIMRYWNSGNYSAARKTIWHAIRLQVVMFIPVEAIGAIFAGPLTRLALGPGHPVPASLLPLLMLGGFFWQIALLVHKPLEIMQRTKTMLCGMLGVVMIECAGNYLLVPRYGVGAVVYVFVTGALAYIAFVGMQTARLREQLEPAQI